MAATIQIGSRSLSLFDGAIAILGALLIFIALFRAPKGIYYRLPYSGLIILFILYGLFGWALKIYSVFWLIWMVLLSGAASIALVPSIELGMVGLRSIILAGIAALAMVYPPIFLIAKWVSLFLATVTAWLWAVGSAKYRMETVGVERSQIVWTIAIVSWAGFWFGWLMESAIAPQLGEWVRQNIIP